MTFVQKRGGKRAAEGERL